MKRFLAILLAVCCLCPMALAANEAALPTVMAFASLDGDFYAQAQEGVFHMTDEGWQKCVAGYSVRAIAAGSGGLYLLTAEIGGDEAFRILLAARREDGSLAEPEPVCTVRWGLRGGDWPEMHGFAVSGDMACILVFDEAASEGVWFNNSLYAVSLADGRADKLTQGLMNGLTVDGVGRILTLDNDRQQAVAIDAAVGTLTDVAPLPGNDCGGLAYDAATDTVCFSRGSGLYDLNGTQVGYLPSAPMPEMMAATVHEGRYYATNQGSKEGYVSCAVDAAQVPSRTLRVCGPTYFMREQMVDFAKAHPEAAVEQIEELPQDAEAFLRHMQSDAAADIYLLNLDCGFFDALRDKGYLADLSASPELMSTVGRMYPQLTRAMLTDGHLYALPVFMYAFTMGYHPAALEKVGLTEHDLPGNHGELLDFIARWEAEFYDRYPDMSLYGIASDLFEQLFNEVLDTRLLLCEEKGEAPTIDTPEMRALLERLEQLRPVIAEVVPVPENHQVRLDPETQLYLTSHFPLPNVGFDQEAERPLLLALTEGERPVISVNMTVMVVNPYSDDLDLATALTAYVAEHLPQEQKTAMMPDENVPVEDAMYTATIDLYREAVADIRAALEKADPADRASLESDLKESEMALREQEEHRWAFDEEDIAHYREHIAPYLTVSTSGLFSSAGGETTTLRSRYLEGQMELAQFIREFDRMVMMRTQEQE